MMIKNAFRDSALIPLYYDAELTATGALMGRVGLLDIATGEQTPLNLGTVAQFTWLP
jgi:hypothetical protein